VEDVWPRKRLTATAPSSAQMPSRVVWDLPGCLPSRALPPDGAGWRQLGQEEAGAWRQGRGVMMARGWQCLVAYPRALDAPPGLVCLRMRPLEQQVQALVAHAHACLARAGLVTRVPRATLPPSPRAPAAWQPPGQEEGTEEAGRAARAGWLDAAVAACDMAHSLMQARVLQRPAQHAGGEDKWEQEVAGAMMAVHEARGLVLCLACHLALCRACHLVLCLACQASSPVSFACAFCPPCPPLLALRDHATPRYTRLHSATLGRRHGGHGVHASARMIHRPRCSFFFLRRLCRPARP